MDDPKIKSEKKSERLDVRIAWQKKRDFAQACENQGDTPSDAVRRFITAYIRRSRRDDNRALFKQLPIKSLVTISAAVFLTALIGFKLMTVHAKKQTVKLADAAFHIYDEDGNGILALGEIMPGDFHLHRVLNIDGKPGISRDEFYLKGRMIWKYVDPEKFHIIKHEDGSLRQTVITRTTVNLKEVIPNQKRFIKVNGEYVEIKDANTIIENIDKIDRDYIGLRESGALELSSRHINKPPKTTLVEFDLTDPDHIMITAFEQKIHGLVSRLAGHQRSVAWVDGRETPELVMGLGREIAVLTDDKSTKTLLPE